MPQNINFGLNGQNALSYMGVNPLAPVPFVTATFSPTNKDFRNFILGTIWLDTGPQAIGQLPNVWMLVSLQNQSASWVLIVNGGSPGATAFPTDSGTAFPNTMGSVNVLGIDGITTSGSGNTITIEGTGATGSGWVNLGAQTANESTALSFTTGISSLYTTYVFIVDNLIPLSDDVNLEMQVSTNGGSSYIGTGYTSGCNQTPWNSASPTNSNITTCFLLDDGQSNSAAIGLSGIYYLQGIGTGLYPSLTGSAFFETSTSVDAFGSYNTAVTVNAVQFTYDSSLIKSGTITMYGIVAS